MSTSNRFLASRLIYTSYSAAEMMSAAQSSGYINCVQVVPDWRMELHLRTEAICSRSYVCLDEPSIEKLGPHLVPKLAKARPPSRHTGLYR
jgi:hypothetical protein